VGRADLDRAQIVGELHSLFLAEGRPAKLDRRAA
jgi:hypothetical protein